MVSKLINQVKDKRKRHQERHQGLGYRMVFSDSIQFVNQAHWHEVAASNSIFLSIAYLQTLEQFSPSNTSQKYAMIYDGMTPVVIVSCQIAAISGGDLFDSECRLKQKVAKKVDQNILVCGNLVSSGLHGVGIATGFDQEIAWRLVSECLYKIRRATKLDTSIDFCLVKDIKSEQLDNSKVLERYSYRTVQTDPDMLLTLPQSVSTFDDYLACLTSKYRAKIKSTIKKCTKHNIATETVKLTPELEQSLYPLYVNVESKSSVRMAQISPGYFSGMAESLGDKFQCIVMRNEHGTPIGFMTMIIDGDQALAYYVGIDYEANKTIPIYLRLMQLVIEVALENRCHKISFGRTALNPKAELGAKPIDTHIWVRHRNPNLNFFVRKLFRNIPFDEAPERAAMKEEFDSEV